VAKRGTDEGMGIEGEGAPSVVGKTVSSKTEKHVSRKKEIATRKKKMSPVYAEKKNL